MSANPNGSGFLDVLYCVIVPAIIYAGCVAYYLHTFGSEIAR